MSRIIPLASAGLLVSLVMAAQPSSNGYMVAGAGSRDSKLTSEGAVGGEWVIAKGVGVGGELGLQAGHDSFGFLSANGYYHFGRGRLDPFVTGGYTLAFSLFGARANAGNFGAGINFRLWRRLGLRGELRDIVAPGVSSPNFWAVRGGLVFR
jgi:hypothetical protein